MQHHVIVSFSKDLEFEFKPVSTVQADEARQWFEREFEALECDVATPTGKILAVDRIVAVAKYAGAERFRSQVAWAEQFAKYAASILGRELIRVDVEKSIIGY